MGVIIDREIKVSCELTTALRTRWKGCRCFPHGCYTKTYGSLPWCTAHTLASSPAWQGNVAVSFAQRARPWLRTWGMPSAADDRVVWPEWSWGHRKDNAKLVLYIKSSWLICYIAWEQKSTFPGGPWQTLERDVVCLSVAGGIGQFKVFLVSLLLPQLVAGLGRHLLPVWGNFCDHGHGRHLGMGWDTWATSLQKAMVVHGQNSRNHCWLLLIPYG